MTAILQDTFTGTGAIGDHTPDIVPVGSSWVVRKNAVGVLSGGRLLSNSNTDTVVNINAGIANWEMEARMNSGSQGQVCVYGRSNEGGTTKIALALSRVDGKVYFNTAAYGTDLVAANTDYWVRWYCFGSRHIVWISTDRETWTLVCNVFITDRLTDTYVGLGAVTLTTTGNWDEMEVSPTTTWPRLLGLGDSTIADTSIGWFKQLCDTYAPREWDKNRGHSGDSITDNLPGQVTLAASDNADKIFIMMGRNSGGGTPATDETVLAAQLSQLHTDHPNAVIYQLCLLESDPPYGTYAAEKAAIQSAVATAQAAGVPVTFWDTAGWIDPATDTSDGIHPTEAGYTKIKNEVLALLSASSLPIYINQYRQRWS